VKELHDKNLEVQKQLAEEIDKFNQVEAELVSFIIAYLCCLQSEPKNRILRFWRKIFKNHL
jgi:hypothetical protein